MPNSSVDPAKRLLVVHPSDEAYGADRILLMILSAAANTWGWAITVLLPDDAPAGWLSAQLRQLPNVSIERGPLAVARRRYFQPRQVWRLPWRVAAAGRFVRRMCRGFEPDVVYVNTLAVPIGVVAGRRSQRIWHVHEILVRPRLMAAVLSSIAVRGSAVCVAVSHAVAAGLERYAKSDIAVIHNGLPDACVGKSFWDRTYDLAFVGRFNAWKGHLVFLESVRQLRRDPTFFDVRAVMAGGHGPHGSEEFSFPVHEAAAAGLVQYVGELDDGVAGLMSDSRLLVVPSLLPDPLPTVAIEGLRAGCVIVGTRAGGIPEIVTPDTGLLVDALPDAIAGACKRVLVDKRRAVGRSAAARRRFLSEFSEERFLEAFRRLLEERLSVQGDAARP